MPNFLTGIVFIRVKTLSNAQLLASRYIKRENATLPVDDVAQLTSFFREHWDPPQVFLLRKGQGRERERTWGRGWGG